MRTKLLMVAACVLCAVSGWVGASLAGQPDYFNLKEALNNQVLFDGKDPSSLPKPWIPKTWRLVSVTAEDKAWFQDKDGNVIGVDMFLQDNGRLGISPNAHFLPAK